MFIETMLSRKQLYPSEIRFTQDSICGRFTDGMFISDTFSQLLNGKITPNQIEDIEVVWNNDAWRAITGNRRLYLYRKLQELGVVSLIGVRMRDLSEPGVLSQLINRSTTNCDGVSIYCRQSRADDHIDRHIEQWRRGTGNQIQPAYGFEVGRGFNSTGFVAPPSQLNNTNDHQRTAFRNKIGFEIPSQLPSGEVQNNEVPSSSFTKYDQRPDSKTSRRSVPASRPGTGTGNSILQTPSSELTNQIQRPGSQTSRRSATYGNAVYPLPNPVAGQLPVSNEPGDEQANDVVSQKKSFSLLRFFCCSVSK